MRKAFISKTGTQLSIRRQAKLVGVNRNRLTPVPRKWTEEELEISLAMDKLHMKRPYYGSRRIHKELEAMGWKLSRGRVRRLMKRMGLIAVYPKPRTSIQSRENKVFPYLLRGLVIDRVEPGLVYGHHVHPDGQGLCLSNCDHGLAQPCGPIMEAFQHDGYVVLCRSFEGSTANRWLLGPES